MRKYELTYLVSDEVPESDLNKVTGKVSGFVKELGGTIAKEEIWGRRKLAYPIKKQDFATYVTLYFDLPADKAIEFEKDLRHIDGIMRQLMLVVEIKNEKISLTKDEIADTTEVADVVGGEAAAEAITGEKIEDKAESDDKKAEEDAIEKVEEPKTKKAKTEEPVVEPASEKPAKKEAKEDKKEEPKEEAEKTVKEKPAKKKETKSSDEAERLSKLNEELDDILKDEL